MRHSINTMLQRFFKLTDNHTNIQREIIAGLTTFLTMAYILFANPAILAGAGMDMQSVFIATCLVSAIGCLLIGILANYPMAIGPGMALNVYFVYTVVQNLGFSWQSALGAVFISGILFLILSVTHIRRLILEAIPDSLAVAIAAGVGMFIALIALKTAGIIIPNPKTLMSLGHISSPSGLLFFFGFFLIVIFYHYRVPGAIVLGILATTILSILLKVSVFHGIFSLPPAHSETLVAMSFKDLWSEQGIVVIVTFLIVALFDSTGTLLSILQYANLGKDPQRTQRISNALVAESIATISGSVLGTSSTSVYVESAAGIKAGGTTGLTAVTIAVLFILALFISPLAQTIPSYATAGALLFIACLMMRSLVQINWDDLSESVPSLLTTLMIPFTFSIADGFGLGIIAYVVIKLCCRDFKAIRPTLVVLALLFVIYFIYKPM